MKQRPLPRRAEQAVRSAVLTMPNTVLLFAVFGTALSASLPKIFLCELGRPV